MGSPGEGPAGAVGPSGETGRKVRRKSVQPRSVLPATTVSDSLHYSTTPRQCLTCALGFAACKSGFADEKLLL